MSVTRRNPAKNNRHSSNYDLLGGGKLALGITIGFAVALGAYLISDLLSADFSEQHLLREIPSILALVVALTSLLISYGALSEQRRLRQAGTDPVVLIHLGSREDARILSTLEVSNVGAGAALNVKVQIKTDISDFVPERIITDFAAVQQAFKTIPQDKSISYNFGLGHALLGEPKIPPILFDVYYEDIDGNPHHSEQVIDVRELKGQRADDGLASRQAKALEQIAKAFKGS